MSDDQEVLSFKAICTFVKDLNTAFGDRHLSLQIYSALLERTGLIHLEPLRKHIFLFRQFVTQNKEAILQRDVALLRNTDLRYSPSVYFDLRTIFDLADSSEKEVIWSHLLTISAILDPSSDAKKKLQEITAPASIPVTRSPLAQGLETVVQSFLSGQGIPTEGPGIDKLQTVFQKVTSCLADTDPNNPVDMIQQVIKSGVVQDVFEQVTGKPVSSAAPGGADLTKIFSSVEKTLGSLNHIIGGVPSAPETEGDSAKPVAPHQMSGPPSFEDVPTEDEEGIPVE